MPDLEELQQVGLALEQGGSHVCAHVQLRCSAARRLLWSARLLSSWQD